MWCPSPPGVGGEPSSLGGGGMDMGGEGIRMAVHCRRSPPPPFSTQRTNTTHNGRWQRQEQLTSDHPLPPHPPYALENAGCAAK